MKLLLRLTLALSLCGCSEGSDSSGLGGLGDGGSGASGGEGGTAGVGGAAARCPAEKACIVDPGVDWTGPFAVVGESDGCSGAFPNNTLVLLQELQEGVGSCTCSCGPSAAVCGTKIQAAGFSSANCVGPVGQHTLTENQCYNTFSDSHSVRLGGAMASCGPGTVTSDIPAAVWGRRLATCQGDDIQPVGCDEGELCVPRPPGGFEPVLCYLREGEHGCPPAFPSRFLSYTGMTDTRRCPSSCECTGSGASCRINVGRYTNANCSSLQDLIAVRSGAQTCAAPDSNTVKSIRPSSIEVLGDGNCSGTANVEGEVTLDGVTTLCCDPSL